MKIAVISAAKVSLMPVEQAAACCPDIELLHFLDEDMSRMAKEEGCVSEKNLSAMKSLIKRAHDAGADGILLSCTIFSPYIDDLRACADIPLTAADIGVFEKAARSYKKIGAVVSFEPTLRSGAWVVERCRKLIRPDFEAQILYADGAFEAAAAGNEEVHNRIIYETAERFENIEAVVLSQMSQIRALPLFERYPLPVLTSPPVSLGLLAEEIKIRSKKLQKTAEM